VRTVQSVATNVVTLTAPLSFDHVAGESATIVTPKVDADYTSAITAMLPDETKNIIVCEMNSDTTASALKTMCDNSASQYNTPCVYFRGALEADTEGTVITKATTLNSKRVVSFYPLLASFNGSTLSGGETAAAIA
jgi:hypothetical protein